MLSDGPIRRKPQSTQFEEYDFSDSAHGTFEGAGSKGRRTCCVCQLLQSLNLFHSKTIWREYSESLCDGSARVCSDADRGANVPCMRSTLSCGNLSSYEEQEQPMNRQKFREWGGAHNYSRLEIGIIPFIPFCKLMIEI